TERRAKRIRCADCLSPCWWIAKAACSGRPSGRANGTAQTAVPIWTPCSAAAELLCLRQLDLQLVGLRRRRCPRHVIARTTFVIRKTYSPLFSLPRIETRPDHVPVQSPTSDCGSTDVCGAAGSAAPRTGRPVSRTSRVRVMRHATGRRSKGHGEARAVRSDGRPTRRQRRAPPRRPREATSVSAWPALRDDVDVAIPA